MNSATRNHPVKLRAEQACMALCFCDYVKVGQEVKVKVLALNDGKISLSMKQALPKEQQQQRYVPYRFLNPANQQMRRIL